MKAEEFIFDFLGDSRGRSFQEFLVHNMKNCMIAYAKQKCKEQREICAMESETPTLYGAIRNAPEPEL